MESANLDTSPKSTPQINTYHCICTTLLLATTHNLTFLPRRAEPALDKAYILQLPPASRLAGEGAGDSLLLSTTQDRKPTIVRREDGFEKRILLRCGRCRLVVGYKLDPVHYKSAEGVVASTSNAGEEENAVEKIEVVYLLPGGLISSEDLKNGKTQEVLDWKE
jgi:hypothetical protein